jgi:hypothetical protein
MLAKTKIVLAAALMLGTASAALAGSVLPGSMDGVNPAYHPRWFPEYGQVMRAYDRANAAIYSGVGVSPGEAYRANGLPPG